MRAFSIGCQCTLFFVWTLMVPSTLVMAQEGSIVVGGNNAAKNLRCEVTCSSDKLRTSVAKIVWEPPTSGGPMGMMDADVLSAQKLEVTVYKNGFKQGQYATLSPLTDTQGAFRMLDEDPSRPRGGPLDLKVIEKEGLAASAAADSEEAAMTIEGLSPGLNYTWRVLVPPPGMAAAAADAADSWQPSVTVSCKGLVCPADMVDGLLRGQ